MVELVEWDLLVPGAEVTFSSFSIPDNRDQHALDIAQLSVSGKYIDIAFEGGKYVVTLYEDEYEDYVMQVWCRDEMAVIDVVKCCVVVGQ